LTSVALFGASSLGVLAFNDLREKLDIVSFCDNDRGKVPFVWD